MTYRWETLDELGKRRPPPLPLGDVVKVAEAEDKVEGARREGERPREVGVHEQAVRWHLRLSMGERSLDTAGARSPAASAPRRRPVAALGSRTSAAPARPRPAR